MGCIDNNDGFISLIRSVIDSFNINTMFFVVCWSIKKDTKLMIIKVSELIVLAVVSAMFSVNSIATEMTDDHKQWLKSKFSSQHNRLIPVVAVADMLFGCNKARIGAKNNIEIPDMIVSLNRQDLADKLTRCLNGSPVDSDLALNFGLIGCFNEQLKQLPQFDRQAKEKLVIQAINSLSKAERQKSFTQCVTDQAIGYLK